MDGDWKSTGGANSETLLVYDSGETSKERLLVFASKECLETLGNSNVWFMDGTTSVYPKLFSQVYVIRTIVEGTAVTCAYGLLPGKTRLHYEEFFQAIVDTSERNGSTPDPKSVHMECVQKDVREDWTTLAMTERGEPPVKRLRKVTQDLQKKLKKLCRIPKWRKRYKDIHQ